MSRSFKFKSEVAVYLRLQAQEVLSEEELHQKSTLLRHNGLMKALGRRLLEASRARDVIQQQDVAIDLLLEALRDGDKAVASEILRVVVQDGQVEDPGVDRAAREQLAGLKAEILYQWSMLAPEMCPTLSTWLPGPVSQKIWQNVQRMQQSNRTEVDDSSQARNMSH